MICSLSHQVFSSEPSFITERASMEPVLGSAACWLAVAFRRMIKLSLPFPEARSLVTDENVSLHGVRSTKSVGFIP